ncbi:MAG: peptidase M3 [Oligoflexia bacterium]|nr:MAG: peptidase M3 [Oligoflexia bacterium]
MTNISENPFVSSYNLNMYGTHDDAVFFHRIQTRDYLPALDEGIRQARENIAAIKKNPAPPNFENTIVALESASELQELVTGVYFNLFSAEASAEHQALAKDISPKNAAFANEVNLDADLFARVKVVYDNMEKSNLNTEQKRLVDKYYKMFIRNGALLSSEKKDQLRKIDQELSLLSPKFSENVLNATNAFEMWITDEKDLAGLPDSAKEAAAFEAERKEKKGQWLFTLQIPSYLPFMQYADSAELRKKMWIAYGSKAYKDQYDNQEIIKKTVQLKQDRAKLLGFATHADYVLEERMAEKPATVWAFLEKLLGPSKKAAEKDLEELKEFKKSLSGSSDLNPWDVAYYSEKLKEKKFHFNEEELRPYFKLENVVQGAFEHARKLYGLTFKKMTDIPVYHPDVTAYEIREEGTNKFMGLFYTDFFPRETKKGGAWMTTYRDQGLWMNEVRGPHVSIVCNFTKPTPTKPSLLTYDEVTTLFHEFGHALHGMLSQCTYRTLSGTNVYWDFVELPSQIMENWVKEKEGLDLFAKHFETNEPIPADLVEKIKKANQFQAGMASLRQLNFGLMDMTWHTADASTIQDVNAFELKATERTRLFPYIEGTNSSCSFSHIFAGGYSAGYYSYKWAEVLDADAFEFFKEKGLFNKEVATAFKNNILSRGGTEHPMALYKKFRGREPDPNALLRRDGLL